MFSYRKRQHRAKTYGLWTLILLLYSHTAYASMNVLNCPSVSDPNGVYKPVCHYMSLLAVAIYCSYVLVLVHYSLQRWYFNATIKCFNDTGHIILGLWAILVLIFCFLLVPFVAIASKGVLQVSGILYHLNVENFVHRSLIG